MAGDQHRHIFGGDRHEFRSHDSGVGNAGDHGLEAIEVSAKICKTDFRGCNLVLVENGADQQVRQRPRRRDRDRLAFEIFHLADT